MSLAQVCERTGMERTICFRLLRTLVAEGFLRNIDSRKYTSNLLIRSDKRLRVGYASLSHDSYSRSVSDGLRLAANERNLDLIEYDNQHSAQVAIRNARKLIGENIDIAIECQVHEKVGGRISAMFREAGIPVIAVDIPMPDAIFFGVDNHKVGLIVGKTLIRLAQREWGGQFDELILLDLETAGAVPKIRLSTTQAVLRKEISTRFVTTRIDCGARQFDNALERTRKHLRITPKRKTLITGVNDYAVLGALRAFEEAGRHEFCLAIGTGALPEGREEMRQPATRLAGSVGFFHESYGNKLIALALDLVAGRAVPPAVYAPTELITTRTIDWFYPREIFDRINGRPPTSR